MKEVFRHALENGEDVDSMASWQVSGPRESFDLDKFAEKHPALYEEYCAEDQAFAARFSMVKAKEIEKYLVLLGLKARAEPALIVNTKREYALNIA